jgi:hypothetical protein
MFSLDMMELGVTYWRETNQPNQWFLKDNIAKRGELGFGRRGIPTYRRRTNQPYNDF